MGIFAHRNCLKKVVLGYFYLVSLLSISALSVFGAEDNSILVAKRDPVKGGTYFPLERGVFQVPTKSYNLNSMFDEEMSNS